VTVTLPIPRVRTSAQPQLRHLSRDLAGRVGGEVRFDDGSRAMYSTDGSNYRQVPIGVVIPRTLDDVVSTVEVCREYGVPVLSRGGGTSLAGQCCNSAVVMDFSKYVNQIEAVDPDRRAAIVQPGIVRDELNAHTGRLGGLVFGPKPSTHDHCTIGGMIGNDSCGSTAQWSGSTAANVRRLEILTYDGTRAWVGPTSVEDYDRIQSAGGRIADIYRQVRQLRDRYAERIRAFPDLPRRISGYNLPPLLPEYGFNLAQALVGSESTCVTVLRAELALLPEPPVKAMVLLGYPDLATAAEAVPEVNRLQPYVLEGLDDKLIQYEKRRHMHADALHLLPKGNAWLLVQFGADDADSARDKVDQLRRAIGPGTTVKTFDDPEHEEQIMAVREAALGATARVPGMADTWPGWEDSAVPPHRLADYLRGLSALLDEFGYGATSLYGHFGHGCVHCSIPFDLTSTAGVAAYRRFVERAADLVVSHGGSLSGEHGDGQSRGELLSTMYGAEGVQAFQEFKAIFDPGNRMNPGKVVHANPLDEQLRLGADYAPAEPATFFHYPNEEGSFARAANRCVGVGMCRRSGGGVMCPSYMVTREEEHSTRGRARLLFEMLQGDPLGDGWRDPAVAEALDLCLACKGCRRDCPVNVDMATYKAEFLAHHYAGRLRPRDHYTLGWLPAAAALASYAPGTANALARLPLTKRLAGIDPARDVPRFARARFLPWFHRRRPAGPRDKGPVVLWPDTFTINFAPHIAAAAVGVLEAAGFTVHMPRARLCCGLTWISTGQLRVARGVLERTMRHLAPHLRAGTPIVGLEPSCTAVFRADAAELLGESEDLQRLQRQTHTLAELLTDRAPDFQPRLAEPAKAVVQTHCHQHAIMGFAADLDMMHRVGLEAEALDSGCCGLAGNFGMTPAHRDVSLACAERVLLPAIRDAEPGTMVLADGFSCRTQIDQAHTGRRPLHLAEVLNRAIRRAPVPA
jgi:FAD/FMN-containing dehydrogenase/Fe-S oxidoreductase